jgi:phosphoribosylformylglycinamidine synthase II
VTDTVSPAAPPAAAAALTGAEASACRAALGREPSDLEWALIGALWSEHTSYKHSRHLLRDLPTTGPAVVTGPGGNAGVVRLFGRRLAFKAESHNHPSAQEPVQGAATGAGGILRDISAMGARPVALWDGLCAGEPNSPLDRSLLRGMVEGISRYGNAVGVPTVGGFLCLDRRYHGVPLVNVMAVGLVPAGAQAAARRSRPGDLVLLFGAATGPDGLGGAVFSSAVRGRGARERAAVQVGDPFRGRLLLEAVDALSSAGAATFLQDLGAAGLAGAAAETAHALGLCLRLDLARVPRRGAALAPEAILLSETQERMLAVTPPDRAEAVLADLHGRGLAAAVVGALEAGPGRLVATFAGRVAADLPTAVLVAGVPTPPDAPAAVAEAELAGPPAPPLRPVRPDRLDAYVGVATGAAGGSRAALYAAYDHTVGARTVRGPGGEAAVLRLGAAAAEGGVAACLTGRPPEPGERPAWAAERSVRLAFARIAAVGGRALGLTDCLNLPSPETEAGGRALAETVAGVARAARALRLPVTGGNVSLYNAGPAGPVPATAVIGAVGSVPLPLRGGGRTLCAGLVLAVVGEFAAGRVASWARGGGPCAAPTPAQADRRSAALVRRGVRRGLLAAALAIDPAGLLAAVVAGIGADEDPPPARPAAPGAVISAPAGEDPGAFAARCADGAYLVGLRPTDLAAFRRLAGRLRVPVAEVGRTVERPEIVLEDATGRLVWRTDAASVIRRRRSVLGEVMGWR